MIISIIKKRLVLVSLFASFVTSAQTIEKQQIGFVDMDYVLLNIASYQEAQQKLNNEVTVWKQSLDKLYFELNKLKEEFENEKPLLTQDLIKEREKQVKIQEEEIIKVENTYFGVEGKLYQLRKQLVEPFQDMVYNAVQEIAKSRKYDMIFEKSSGLTLLYTNNNYDISDLVIRYLQKTKKEIEQEEAEEKRKVARDARLARIEEQRKKREEQLNKK